MYSITELRKGTLIEHEGAPYRVIESQHVKLGRGGAIMRTKLKNLLTGGVLDVTFRGGAAVAPANVSRKNAQFLYKEGGEFKFMDAVTFEQYSLTPDEIGEAVSYLREGDSANLSFFQEKVVGVEIPIKIDLAVAATETGAKGDTATNALKDATLETGLIVKVPLFIKEGDVVKIDTRTGKYLERVN